MKQINVIPIGSQVGIQCPDSKSIPATIAGVCIYKSHVEYQVIWWDGNTRKCEWIKDFELCEFSGPSMPIGFANVNGSRVVQPFLEGRMSKGGQNPPNNSTQRPPPPGPAKPDLEMQPYVFTEAIG